MWKSYNLSLLRSKHWPLTTEKEFEEHTYIDEQLKRPPISPDHLPSGSVTKMKTWTACCANTSPRKDPCPKSLMSKLEWLKIECFTDLGKELDLRSPQMFFFNHSSALHFKHKSGLNINNHARILAGIINWLYKFVIF